MPQNPRTTYNADLTKPLQQYRESAFPGSAGLFDLDYSEQKANPPITPPGVLVWRQTIRDEAQRVRLNTDPHSPGEFRTNGPTSNRPEFFSAFGCAAGSPMVRPPDVRTSIW